MKKIFLAITIAFSLTMTAQTKAKSTKKVVPTNVKQAFAKEFPGQKAKWEKEDGGYEAEFKIKNTDASAVYDKNGYKKTLEITIQTEELPTDALAYLKQNYPTNKITEASKITDDKNRVTYEAEIQKKGKSYDVLFDSNGKFIKIEKGD